MSKKQTHIIKGKMRQDINVNVRHKRGCLGCGGCLVPVVAVFLLAVIVIGSVAFSASANAAEEPDLESMSYVELVTLRDKINLAMWTSRSWQEVIVPQGIYVVGEDIPAGHWTIKPEDGFLVGVRWGDKKDKSGTDVSSSGDIYVYESLYSVNQPNYRQDYRTEVDFILEGGQYVVIDFGNAIFSPYEGKKELGFK